jgi:LysR family hydrogen peroxide-inducible transcriptional activator
MNLRDLTYLVALADYRHFGRAADASFVSQPTLSTQIKKLEAELGVTLIDRAPRKVLLTDAGEQIVARARNVLHEIAQIKSIARQQQDPESGTLRLGIFPTLGPYLLPHVLDRLRTSLPRLELLLTEEKTESLLKRLHAGQLDAAILAQPIHDAGLRAEFLFEEPFVLATPSGHALAGKPALKVADLAHQQLLLLEEGHCLRDQALEVCHLSNASERSEFRATSLETLRQMVAMNVGITLLPVLAVQPPIARTANICLTAFQGAHPSRRLAIFWRKTSALHELLLKVARIFQSLPVALLDPIAASHPTGRSTNNRQPGTEPAQTQTLRQPSKAPVQGRP